MSAWLAAILSAVLSLLGKVAEAWFQSRQASAEQADANAAHERAGAAEAASETQQAITEIADARAGLPSSPVDPAGLAASLRQRAAAIRAAGPAAGGGDKSRA